MSKQKYGYVGQMYTHAPGCQTKGLRAMPRRGGATEKSGARVAPGAHFRETTGRHDPLALDDPSPALALGR